MHAINIQMPSEQTLERPSFTSEEGSQIYWGYKFLERKIGGIKFLFNDQKVGSHKMTTDSVFILFKKTDFYTILTRLGGKVYR